MAMVLGNTMLTAVSATGNVKYYQLWVTIVGCLVFPLTWLAYELGFPVEIAYILYAIIYFILIFVRLYFVKKQLDFPVTDFIKKVLIKILVVSIAAFIIPTIVNYYIPASLGRLILTIFCATISSISSILVIGLEQNEKHLILAKVKQLIYRTKLTNHVNKNIS